LQKERSNIKTKYSLLSDLLTWAGAGYRSGKPVSPLLISCRSDSSFFFSFFLALTGVYPPSVQRDIRSEPRGQITLFIYGTEIITAAQIRMTQMHGLGQTLVPPNLDGRSTPTVLPDRPPYVNTMRNKMQVAPLHTRKI